MLANMACSLILHKRIETTVAKAKALRVYVEPLITKCKDDSTHSRRITFAHLRQKEVISELFNEVSQKVANRPGGYTRILKLSGTRIGDNADRCIIELVDYNSTYTEIKSERKSSSRRRRSFKKVKTEEVAPSQEIACEFSIVEETQEIKETPEAENISKVEDTPEK
jgi:large subunit ribosomal protein L17